MFLTLASFAFFTALVAGITYWKSRGGVGADSDSGFFLAGRSLTFPFIAFSLLLTNLSTEQLVGLNGQGFTTGLAVMMWEVVAVVAIVLMALFFLPKFLKSGITTVPELLDIRFGGAAQLVCNIIFLLAYIFILLPMILYTGAKGMSGILDLKALTGIQSDTVLLWGVIWMIGLIGTGYAIFGGLKSIVISDLLNGIGLLVGGFMITFFGLWACGKIDLAGGAALGGSIARGWANLVKDLPDHVNSIAGEGSQAPFFEIFTGVMLINTFYWCTNQQIIQRTLAASSLKEGQKGVLLCGLLKLIGPLYLILPGIMAYFLFKHGAIVPSSAAVLDETTGLIKEANAYGELVRTVLPPWLAGFFAAAMIGAVLSSFNSALNSTCTLFSVGIYQKLFPEAGEKRAVKAGKRFGLVLAIAAMSLSPFLDVIPSIFGYLQKMNAIYFIPILAVVLLGLVSRRAKQATAVFGMLAGAGAIACGYFVLPLLGEKWDVVARLGEYDFVALVFLVVFDLMLLWRLVAPSGKAHEFHDAKAVDLTPWGGAKWASLALLAVIVAIYAYFADFAPLRIDGDIPWESFSATWVAAVLPTVVLLWLDRRRE